MISSSVTTVFLNLPQIAKSVAYRPKDNNQATSGSCYTSDPSSQLSSYAQIDTSAIMESEFGKSTEAPAFSGAEAPKIETRIHLNGPVLPKSRDFELERLAYSLIKRAAYKCYYSFGFFKPKIPRWWGTYNEIIDWYELYDTPDFDDPTDTSALKFYWVASRLRPEFEPLIPPVFRKNVLFEQGSDVDRMCDALARVVPLVIKETPAE